uniref:Putative secreted protein n=1 Tax=Anopheles darlingi TaxID=43151 RepID=A0A2M4DML1_ANODA
MSTVRRAVLSVCVCIVVDSLGWWGEPPRIVLRTYARSMVFEPPVACCLYVCLSSRGCCWFLESSYHTSTGARWYDIASVCVVSQKNAARCLMMSLSPRRQDTTMLLSLA